MRQEDVKNIVATPINAPVFPAVDIFFRNREYLNIIYETDIEALQNLRARKPTPLEVG